ncbi:hypothetical protein [Methylobacterium sp. D54C]
MRWRAKKAVGPSRASAPLKVLLPTLSAKKPWVRIFVSYCCANAATQSKLQIHPEQLKSHQIKTCFVGDIYVGDWLDTKLSRTQWAAHVFVALMSPKYLHSRGYQLKYKQAMGRRARSAIRVVVVIVRPCDWKATDASERKVLPREGRLVSGRQGGTTPSTTSRRAFVARAVMNEIVRANSRAATSNRKQEGAASRQAHLVVGIEGRARRWKSQGQAIAKQARCRVTAALVNSGSEDVPRRTRYARQTGRR